MLLALLEFSKDNFAMMLAWYLMFIVAITLHEAAHALAAWKLGDPTAYYGGQVTINPLPHIEREPVGTIAIPIIFYWLTGFMIGWAHAPYDPHWAIRYPGRSALMALAGPIANLLLVLIACVIIRVGFAMEFFTPSVGGSIFTNLVSPVGEGMAVGGAKIVSIMFSLNLLLFIFNLMPVPPLDGSQLIIPFLSPSAAHRYREFIRQPMVSIMGLVLAWQLFPRVYWAIVPPILKLLYSGY